MTLGLRAKIVLLVLLAVLVGLGTVVAIGHYRYGDAYVAALQSRSVAIAQGLRLQMDRVLQPGVRVAELTGFERQCKRVVDTYDGVEFAMVVDPEGRILFASDAGRNGTRLTNRDLLAAVQGRAETNVRYVVDGREGYGAAVPILGPDQAFIGSVLVGLSAKVIDDKLRDIRIDVFVSGMVLLALGTLVLVFATGRFVTRPVQALVHSIEQVRSDPSDFGRRVEVKTADEIGTLARAFNGLMQRLQDTTVSKSTLEEAYAALQASEEKYRHLVSDAGALILQMNLDGTISHFNEYAERFFGYTSKEILGRNVVGTILPPRTSDDQQDLRAMAAAILAKPENYATNENENVTKDGRRVYVRWANRVLLDAGGKPLGVLSVGQDITEKWLADKELERHRDHLEELVRERTAALSVAKDAAEAANRAKTAFLANMSHELRTPMNGIMGMTELALGRATDPKQAEYLKHVAGSSQRLLGIISDLLDITRIESERLVLDSSRFRLGDVLDSLTGLVAVGAEQKGLAFTIDVPRPVADLELVGDAERLGQVLINLTGNAIKFTERGSVVVVAALVEEDKGAVLLRFEIHDTGIGISERDQRRMFAAFEQADNSLTRRYGGTGLGLAISRRLVTLMGGEIGVDSVLGEGSTFWFTARLRRGGSEAPAGVTPGGRIVADQLRAFHAGARVLVVEDEPLNREVTRGLLDAVGIVVDVAEDGVEGVQRVAGQRYDAVLMDVQMPNMNGLDATQQIRQLPGGGALPIIALTANAFSEDRTQCLAVGMDDFLAKPVLPETLYRTLLRWLSTPRH